MTHSPDRSMTLSAAEGSPDPPAGDRLDSWKEIAAFLQRDVRTVQRWEKHAGLPVHRHAEARLRTAFAYRSELEAWWRAQPPATADDVPGANPVDSLAGAPTTPGPAVARHRVVIGVGAVLVVLTGVLVAVASRVLSIDRPITAVTASAPVSVLLTRFDDEAGEPGLAAMVEEIVARELGRQRDVDAVAPVRIRRTLRLMRLGVETPITSALGRELALRDGQIPLVIVGKVHKLHSRYFADLEAIGPREGRLRVSVERHGETAAELLASVTDESPAFAAALLAAARADTAPREALEPVTTASLPALRLYTAAVQAGQRRQWRASELLARRAVTSDPQFAAAHAWAAWAMRQQGHPAPACLEGSSRGLELSHGLTDRETYLIAALHHAISWRPASGHRRA